MHLLRARRRRKRGEAAKSRQISLNESNEQEEEEETVVIREAWTTTPNRVNKKLAPLRPRSQPQQQSSDRALAGYKARRQSWADSNQNKFSKFNRSKKRLGRGPGRSTQNHSHSVAITSPFEKITGRGPERENTWCSDAQTNLLLRQNLLLHKAADQGNANLVYRLIQCGADFRTEDVYGVTPFVKAASNGQVQCLSVLLRAKADINSPDQSGATACFVAAAFNHTTTLRWLVHNGADCSRPNKLGLRPFEVAKSRGHAEAARIIASVIQRKRASVECTDDRQLSPKSPSVPRDRKYSSYWRVTKAGAADRLRAMPTLSDDENHNGREDVELIQQLQHSPRRRRCSATRVAKLVHTAPTPLAGVSSLLSTLDESIEEEELMRGGMSEDDAEGCLARSSGQHVPQPELK